jgi:uncharacterized protein YbaR (Trm112 family)
MIILSQYEISYNTKYSIYQVNSAEESNLCCPYCNGILKFRDRKRRSAIRKENNERCWYLLQRLKCKDCGKIHVELPDFMLPYKHYDAEMVQDTIDEKEENYCAADDSTIRRWKTSFKFAKARISALLIAMWMKTSVNSAPLFKAEDALCDVKEMRPCDWLTFVIRMLVNGGYRICTQFAFCP